MPRVAPVGDGDPEAGQVRSGAAGHAVVTAAGSPAGSAAELASKAGGVNGSTITLAGPEGSAASPGATGAGRPAGRARPGRYRSQIEATSRRVAAE